MHGNFYEQKKILLTGHTGFKGTWMSFLLERLGAKVYGYALPDEGRTFFQDAAPKVEASYEGDITDQKHLEAVLSQTNPEIVIHFASHSSLNDCMEKPEYILNTNIMGLVRLMEAVKKTTSVRTVLIITSDKCYKNLDTNQLYIESNPLGAQDPYSTSKACQEMIAECYKTSFFQTEGQKIALATARASNVIGGGDYNSSRLIPYLLECFSQQKKAAVRKPDAVRTWQYVLDVLGGYLLLIEKMYQEQDANSLYCNAFNFGPSPDGFVSVGELANMLSAQFPGSTYQVIEEKRNVMETNVFRLDSSKAQQILGWQQVYNFDETIRLIADYKKRSMTGESIRELCLDYVDQYLKRSRGI